ncbi:MAG: gliding motility lipoprotein GldH [Prevotellaceae bacterium]|nr:gliding motility lipoprotein GldH [Prevotellaceae bacterium]
MKIRKYLFIISLFSIFCAVSCTDNDVFFQYKKIPSAGWDKDSVLVFDFKISDASSLCNVYVNIRNTSAYPYQNFWLFIKKSVADNDSDFVVFATDTVECYLADERGKWLGSGVGATCEMPLLIEKGTQFARKTYRYELVQGMRNDVLRGINDIGLRVEKIE